MKNHNILLNEVAYKHLTERETEILSLVASGLSNREIADTLFIAHSTVRWFLRQIYSKLGVEAREEAIKIAQKIGLSFSGAKHNLPAKTSAFIGREQELADLTDLLTQPNIPLITILASGGMGKTSLALELARRQIDNYADGIYFIDLAPLASASYIIPTIADVLKLQRQTSDESKKQLLDYLCQKQILLVLDNFEHVLEGVSLVQEILQVAPHVTLLVTSREKLALSGETVYPIRGMSIPDSDVVEGAIDSDAMRLFVQCANLTNASFQANAEDWKQIIRICRIVEGMPLAIKLAASWVDVLSLSEIVSEIHQSIDFLEVDLRDIPTRHKSIRAVFDTTWNRLSDDQKRILMRFSVFRGGCTRQAAQVVTGATLHHLHRLNTKALLSRNENGRYEIHELLRQYVKKKLTDSEELDATLETYARYYADFTQALIPDIKGKRQIESRQEFLADFENFRYGWYYACDQGDYDAIASMAECLVVAADIEPVSATTELFNYVDTSASIAGNKIDDRMRNRIRAWQIFIFNRYNQHSAQILKQIDDCIEIAKATNDSVALILSYITVGDLASHAPQLPPTYHDALQLSKNINDLWLQGITLRSIASYYAFENPIEDPICLEYLDQYLIVTQQSGDMDGLAAAYFHRAIWEYTFSSIVDAEYHMTKAKALYQQANNHFFTTMSEGAIATLLLWQGRLGAAKDRLIPVMQFFGEMKNENMFFYIMLGIIEGVHGNSNDGLASLNKAMTYLDKLDAQDTCLLYVGKVICYVTSKNFTSLHQTMAILFELELKHITVRNMLNLLPILAVASYQSGDYEKSTELLGLVYTHPKSLTLWMDKWEALTQLKIDLSNELGEEQFKKSWDYGTSTHAETVIREYIDDFKN